MRIASIMIICASFLARAGDFADSISFGPQTVGDTNVQLDLSEFSPVIEWEMSGFKTDLNVSVVESSLQWVRLHDGILMPCARVKISTKQKAENISLQYDHRSLNFQSDADSSFVEIFYSLYQANVVELLYDGKKIATIRLVNHVANSKTDPSKRAHIDYSCASSQLRIDGLSGEYLSAQCKMLRVGVMGSEEPMLEVTWIAMNQEMKDPVTAIFRSSASIKRKTIDNFGKEKIVELTAVIPKRMNRMKFAGGIGPYTFEAHKDAINSKHEVTPAAMLYGNFYLSDTSSFRGFDALVTQNPTSKAFFNNFGLYFAYDLARVLDSRFQLMALLGAQGLTFAYQGLRGSTFSQAIFPQGFELTYNHAFGIKNNVLGYGMFVFPSTTNPYNNIWLRYGKRIFGEINFISWELGDQKASMLGVSVGFPLAGFF